jgi:hypothetical protein
VSLQILSLVGIPLIEGDQHFMIHNGELGREQLAFLIAVGQRVYRCDNYAAFEGASSVSLIAGM